MVFVSEASRAEDQKPPAEALFFEQAHHIALYLVSRPNLVCVAFVSFVSHLSKLQLSSRSAGSQSRNRPSKGFPKTESSSTSQDQSFIVPPRPLAPPFPSQTDEKRIPIDDSRKTNKRLHLISSMGESVDPP